REGGVAAGEDQAQAVVARLGFGHGRSQAGASLLDGSLTLPAHSVERLVACGHDDPRHRVPGHAQPGPGFERGNEGTLHRLLGGIDVAKETDEGTYQPPVFEAEGGFDRATG